MAFKFEKLEIWKAALDYVDLVYDVAMHLPADERFNLKDQIRRAATSVQLNIAEGSTGQTDDEQARFLGMALRSLIETVACLLQAIRRKQIEANAIPLARQMYRSASILSRRIQTMRKAIAPAQKWIREETVNYEVEIDLFDQEDDSDSISDSVWISSIVRRLSSSQQEN